MLTCRADHKHPSRSPACTCGAAIATRRQTGRHGTPSRSRGFSFTEILFAVIVLGIGFIMIAAIFPVAIQQGKLTSEQGAATGVAREALNYLGQVGANSDSIPYSAGGPLFPATGSTNGIAPYFGAVYSFRDPQPAGSKALDLNQNPANDPLLITPAPAGRTVGELWNRLNLSLVVPSDQRFAFVGLYRRNGNPADRKTWSPYVQAWFIPTTTRSRSIYNPGSINTGALSTLGPDIYNSNAATPLNLQARLVKISIDLDPNAGLTYSPVPPPSPQVLQNFSPASVAGYVLYNWTGPVVPAGYQPSSLSEGCYVIIANDQIQVPVPVAPALVSVNQGRMNGRIYHVGHRRPDLDVPNLNGSSVTAYDLAPDGGFTPDVGADGFFGMNNNNGIDDDILTIGMTSNGTTNANPDNQPFDGASPYGNTGTSGVVPADAYIVGTDLVGSDPGTSQEISAFTTFIKVN